MTALGPSRLDPPHGLWSLWDIMKAVSVARLLRYAAIGGIAAVRVQYDERNPAAKSPDVDILKDWALGQHIASSNDLEEDCIVLEFTSSLAAIRKIQAALSKSNPTYSGLHPLQIELEGRITDEAEAKVFFALNVIKAEYYKNPRKGWEEIIERFPDALTDVEESQLCYALERYAAAVFHSLQVVEIGLIELGRVLVVTDPQTGWNATTKKLNTVLNTKYPSRTPFQQQHQKFLEQIAATIEMLKSAWRNKVSHAQDKLVLLRTDFTPAIAEEILIASRSFMRRLATEAPATPDPDA
jgi:hypothetical protein